MNLIQEAFLRKAARAAGDARHIFPEYAACEVAIESGWGESRLAVEANNLFGQKQCQPPLSGTKTMLLPTREYLRGNWVSVDARWVMFATWNACFASRMELLRKGSVQHPHYAAALRAQSGEEFIREVSQSWSTDPTRASKVLAIYSAHLASLSLSPPVPAKLQ